MDDPQHIRGRADPVAPFHEDRRRQIEVLRDALRDVQRAKAFAMLPRVVQDKVRAALRWKP